MSGKCIFAILNVIKCFLLQRFWETISCRCWETISVGQEIRHNVLLLRQLIFSVSSHSVTNPDQESERKLLYQLAPELDEETIGRLVFAFQDLRKGYDAGALSYPYSLRGLFSQVHSYRPTMN